jgi:phosphatidylethanolamine-binding protein (PEBP) family uncharacterized protein
MDEITEAIKETAEDLGMEAKISFAAMASFWHWMLWNLSYPLRTSGESGEKDSSSEDGKRNSNGDTK